MTEDMKMFIKRVDTLENVVNAFEKYVSTKNLSWCREKLGIIVLIYWECTLVASCMKRKQ